MVDFGKKVCVLIKGGGCWCLDVIVKNHNQEQKPADLQMSHERQFCIYTGRQTNKTSPTSRPHFKLNYTT